MAKKVLIGKVVSNKMQKTVVVAVEVPRKHPILKKQIKNTKRFKAHSNEKLEVGTVVKIEEARPKSRDKRWRVVKN